MKIRKIVAFICVIFLVTSFFSTTVDASTTPAPQNRTGSSYFNNEWEFTTYYYVNNGSVLIGYLTWGYDTDWVNEDYAWSTGREAGSQSFVKRNYYDTSYQPGTWQMALLWSKCEITHATYNVSYKVTFDATYSGITSTTTTSNFK